MRLLNLFPDPPILHPTFLEEKEIIVTVDDSWLFDRPAEQIFQTSGFGEGMPFSKNESVTECLAVYPHFILGRGGHLYQYSFHLLLKWKAWRTGTSDVSPLGKRAIEHYYGGNVCLKPLFSIVTLEFRNMCWTGWEAKLEVLKSPLPN